MNNRGSTPESDTGVFPPSSRQDRPNVLSNDYWQQHAVLPGSEMTSTYILTYRTHLMPTSMRGALPPRYDSCGAYAEGQLYGLKHYSRGREVNGSVGARTSTERNNKASHTSSGTVRWKWDRRSEIQNTCKGSSFCAGQSCKLHDHVVTVYRWEEGEQINCTFLFHHFHAGNTTKPADCKTKIWRHNKSTARSADQVQ